MSESFLFSSPDGIKLVESILRTALPDFEPHIYQPPGICKALDGVDVVAVTPTGSGKTGYFFMTLLVMQAIGKNPSLCPGKTFPKDPVLIAVCPTNNIEKQMEERMARLGITALAINADTVAAARQKDPPVDLWETARKGVSMLLLSPEQLVSKSFATLLAVDAFYERVSLLGIDEIHLLVVWGKSFRKAFTQIGFMRSRLPPHVPLIGLTATLHSNFARQNAIFELLGVNRGEFFLLKRSNARYDIQILFRTLHSGISGTSFPELAWVLQSGEKTLIFGASINLVFRLKMYFHNLLADDPHQEVHVQTVHGLNWPEENEKAIRDLTANPNCQIIIATNTLAQGTDIPIIKLVMHIGEPESSEMYVQKPGRAGRDPTLVQNPRAIFYISKTRMLKAAKVVGQSDAENTIDDQKAPKGAGNTSMSRDVAELLLADCKVSETDRQFANPSLDTQPVCECALCQLYPVTLRPELCTCSGCQPEDPASSEMFTPSSRARTANPIKDLRRRLTGPMKDYGTRSLRSFRLSIWKRALPRTTSLTPLHAFLPDTIIQFILDRFANFHSVDDVAAVVQSIAGMKDHEEELFSCMQVLQHEFDEMRTKKAAASMAKKNKRRAVIGEDPEEDESAEDDEDTDGDSEDDESDEVEVEGPRERLMIRIKLPAKK